MDTTYVQGFSTSLPRDVQERMTHTLPGFENCIIKKYAYAIEYDAIDPVQMRPSLENRIIENLFTAGQVNGTSGYEEAAGQGIIAGINAVRKLDGKAPIVLSRDEAYIGVLIDDLTTKGTKEPYRLLTSRAEFRLLLRHDNADQRLLEKGYEIGLIGQERYDAYCRKMEAIRDLKEQLGSLSVSQKENPDVSAYLESLGYDALTHRTAVYDLIKRPGISLSSVLSGCHMDTPADIAEQCEIEIRYEGYIRKARREAAKLNAMDRVRIPEEINYDDVDNLSIEGRQKLKEYRPETMGQASRISGVNPADIAVLAIHLKQKEGKS